MSSDDVIVGHQWLATLDRHACLKCAARDGLRYTLDHKPIGHSVPWRRGPGRIHRGCRCVTLPMLAAEFDFLGRGAMRPSVCDGKAAQVLAVTTYNDWLRSCPEHFQHEVLGWQRAQVWRNLGLHLTDLLDADGLPLSIAALTAKSGLVGK